MTQVFLTGIATSRGVDAMTDVDAEAHGYSIDKTFPRLGRKPWFVKIKYFY